MKRRKNMARIVYLTAAIMFGFMLADVANGQEVPDPYVDHVRSGVLCDNEEDLEKYLTAVSLETPVNSTTCGRFAPRGPIPMQITPLYWYQLPEAIVLVAKLQTFDGWQQFGWIGWKPVEQPEAGEPL